MNIFERQLQLKLKCAGHEIARCGMRIHRLRERNHELAKMLVQNDVLNRDLLIEARNLLAITQGQTLQINRLQKTVADVEMTGDPTYIRRLQAELVDAQERVKELEAVIVQERLEA